MGKKEVVRERNDVGSRNATVRIKRIGKLTRSGTYGQSRLGKERRGAE